MQIIECKQGTHEWHQSRLGILTASKAHVLCTPKGKPTANATRRRYALELALEKITKMPTHIRQTFAMERGHELEPQARIWYYLETQRSVKEVGFILSDDGNTGYSPDGVVGDDGLIEIKCFEMYHYALVLTTGEIDHDILMQCQHGMYVTGRKWVDFVLYTDVEPFKGYIQRIHRDEEMCAKIGIEVTAFTAEVEACTKSLIEKGGLTKDMLMFDAPVFSDVEHVEIEMSDMEGGER